MRTILKRQKQRQGLFIFDTHVTPQQLRGYTLNTPNNRMRSKGAQYLLNGSHTQKKTGL